MNPVIIGDATLYLGDCRQILPSLRADALISDPPYGLGDKMTGGTKRFQTGEGGLKTLGAWDAQIVEGLVDLIEPVAPVKMLWGGNYYPVPGSRGWLVWVKTNSVPSMASVELCWTNLDMNAKHFSHLCNGWHRDHPTQKPIALMDWCISFVPDAEIILDPFMGAGTTGVAAIRAGKRFIGIEQEERHFESACRRIEQAAAQGKLFEEPRREQVQDGLFNQSAAEVSA